MKYHGRKIKNAIISLVVVLTIVLGSFYYGSLNHASYGQMQETENTVADVENTDTVNAPDETDETEETEATVLGSLEAPKAINSSDTSDTENKEISETEDKTQTGEVNESSAEEEGNEEKPDSEQVQDEEGQLKSKADNKEAEELKNKLEAEAKEQIVALSVGRGSLTGDISSVVKMKLKDLYIEKNGDQKYIIKNGGKPDLSETLSELNVNETLHLDYEWEILYDKEKGLNEIQHIKQGNYFQEELPDYKVFNNFEMISQEVFVKKENSSEQSFKFGEYSIVKIGDRRYLRLTMTEKDEHYKKNILGSVTGGNPKLTFKVRKEIGEHQLHLPGTDKNVTGEITITIKEGPTLPAPSVPEKPKPAPEDNGGYEKPDAIVKESGQDYGKDRIRWWLHINRDIAYDMFSDNFNATSTVRKNLVVSDDITKMTATNPNADFSLDSSSVKIYLDMLKPIIKNNKVVGFSHGPVFGYDIYRHNGNYSILNGYFNDKVTADNKKFEIKFGDMPNIANTYRKVFGDSDINIAVLGEFLTDQVISNPDNYTKEVYWAKVKEYKDKLTANGGGKNFTDFMMDAVTGGKVTVNQAKIMKKTYWDSNMPIMHYTVQFDTVFRGMNVGDTATNTANLKADGVDKIVQKTQEIKKVYLTDSPVTRSPKVDIVINKLWKDAAGNDMEAPKNEIEVQLLQDGKSYGKPVKIEKAKNWTYTFEKLPGYREQNVEFQYSIQELNIDGYDVNIEKKDTGKTITFTITNKKKQGNIHFNIKKEWLDKDGQEINDTSKLHEVEVQVLMKKSTDSTFVEIPNRPDLKNIKLNHNNQWTYKVEGLNELDEADKKIEYKVKEVKVPAGYLALGGDVFNSSTCTFTVTNKEIPKINIQVEKKWVDNNNNTLKPDYKKIPDKVEVQVLVNGEVKQTIFVYKNQNWSGEFKDLPKLDNDGNIIKYEVREINVPNGFTVLSTVKDGENKFVITNKKTDEVVKLNITKKWFDLNNQAITDNNLLPDNVSFQILANGAVKDTIYVYKNANWTYVSENLAKLDENGVEIVYTIKELNVPYGYVATVEKGSYELSFIVTNKQTPPSIPFIPPFIPTPPTPVPPTPVPPPDTIIPEPKTPLTDRDEPDEDTVIDDDDVAKSNKEEDDEDVIDDRVPLVNLPKTGMNNPLVYLVVISVVSLVMIFKVKSKK